MYTFTRTADEDQDCELTNGGMNGMPWSRIREKTIDHTKVTILGAGHAGRGIASYLSIHGFEISLYNRTIENVKGIIDRGGIDAHGIIEGFAPIKLVTDDIAAAINGRNILIITVPAQAHPFFAETMGPYLKSEQAVLLMPGRTGGALEFARILKLNSFTDDILLGEAQTFSFVSRTTGPDSVLISSIKNSVRISAFPASLNRRMLKSLKRLPLAFELADDVMETSLNNMGAMLHPAPTILCAGLLESRQGGHNHYHEGISKTVGHLVERMDAERVRVAQKFLAHPVCLLEWLKNTYDAKGNTLYECLRSIDTYDRVGSPSSLEHRYVLEDIPTGLVPISYLGTLAGIETPAIDAVINIACQLYRRDFWHRGRNLESLGFKGLNLSEIKEYVQTGVLPDDYSSIQEMLGSLDLEVDER
ncbi:MAG: NAD/NADP octopine/nopaline dehydrogenase family protein [Candidatus Thorarchaeota archaeon]|nr:NAD/NADP octopine/nopaline dehydrogenase family protein [Candidatus Thorarchaeota archaeon]